MIDGWTVTVASVGDSRCILDTQGGVVSLLTVDHRLEENVEERERVTASGGEVGRLNIFGGNEVRRTVRSPLVVLPFLPAINDFRGEYTNNGTGCLLCVFQVGPLRCWPGGLCLSRSIGDTDVGEFIVPVPHVKQVKVSH